MRILIGHNHYRYWGGEDVVFSSEAELLRKNGEEVYLFEKSNKDFGQIPFWSKIERLFSLGYSKESYSQLRVILKSFKPDVAHFHNTYFMMTPSVYEACQDENVPVVQSLHNFRLTCANALLFRNGHPCEECVKGPFWPGVRHRCYQRSFFLSAMMVSLNNKCRKNNVWNTKVDKFIAASEFAKEKFIAAGLPPEKITVKANFSEDRIQKETRKTDSYALYFGRLSEEKGVEFLVKAWAEIRGFPLRIAGTGPLENVLKKYVENHRIDNVEFLGFIDSQRQTDIFADAKIVIVPSLCYENFPRVIAEAFSFGKPVVCTRIGGFPEIVKDGETGWLFSVNDKESLKEKVFLAFDEKADLQKMGQKARKSYEKRFSPYVNYHALMDIYQSVQRK